MSEPKVEIQLQTFATQEEAVAFWKQIVQRQLYKVVGYLPPGTVYLPPGKVDVNVLPVLWAVVLD